MQFDIQGHLDLGRPGLPTLKQVKMQDKSLDRHMEYIIRCFSSTGNKWNQDIRQSTDNASEKNPILQ